MNKKYLESVKDFEDLFKFAIKLSKDTHGREVDTRRKEVASFIFTKICLHCASILRILPKSSFSQTKNEFEVWDYTSLAVLTRSVIDAYYVFYYLCSDEITVDEREFRFLVWDYHSENRRLKQLKLIGSEHKDLPDIEKNVLKLKDKVKAHKNLSVLEKNFRKGIVRGEIPFILTNLDIAKSAGINEQYHKASYMYLSSYIHTFPFAISQTSAIKNLDQIIELAKPILDQCFGYLCLCIRDFIILFPDQKVYLVGALQEKIKTWEIIFNDLFG